MNGVNAQRVLRCQRRNRGHSETTERAHRFDVSLDAGAAARIRTSDDEDPSVHDPGLSDKGSGVNALH
jgi:hypothetical protein